MRGSLDDRNIFNYNGDRLINLWGCFWSPQRY